MDQDTSRRPFRTAFLAVAWLAVADAATAQSARPVSVVTPQRVEVQDLRRLTGTVTAERVSALSARIDGVVAQVAVDAGDTVARGDVILRLDDELARLDQAQVRASVLEGRARLDEARRVAREAEELAAGRNLPTTQAEAARAQARIGVKTLARLEAESALQEARLQRHVLRAPFAGVIAARHVDPGEWITASGAVVDLVSLDALRFDVRAPQELYARLDVDDAVTVQLDALPGPALPGRVAALVPVAETGTRSFLLRVTLDSPPPTIIPGMSGRLSLALGRAGEGWSVPRDAIVSYPDGTRSVWIVTEGDGGLTASARRVRPGRALNGRIEILDGLDGGEQVVVRGNESLTDGEPVRIVDAVRD